ncbi:MAG: HAD family hydrolase [candidate division WOR-3 bacterium]|nr:HAD family hydrolase [candidate division WOR-3 bacterium]
MTFKAVIFDLDGTLLDTIQDIADSMNAVLTSLGFPIYKIDDYYYLVGEGIDALCRKVIPEDFNTPELITRCVEMMKVEYHKNWFKNTKPYPGISELLIELQKRKIKMAVHSNKLDEFTKLFIQKFFPQINFSAVVGASVEIPKKPAPDGALYIAHIFNIPPEQIVYLGDSNIDIRTAVAAGMYPVGALWGFRSANELLQAGAKYLIRKPEELLEIL